MRRKGLLLAAALLPAAAVVLYAVPPTEGSLYPRCLYHSLTGWHCPGCGTARCLHALSHGDLLQAAAYNVLTVLLLPLLAAGLGRQGYATLTGRRGRSWRLPAWSIHLLLIVILAFWFLRNLDCLPFRLLAPHPLN
jgi:hypothetical protein